MWHAVTTCNTYAYHVPYVISYVHIYVPFSLRQFRPVEIVHVEDGTLWILISSTFTMPRLAAASELSSWPTAVSCGSTSPGGCWRNLCCRRMWWWRKDRLHSSYWMCGGSWSVWSGCKEWPSPIPTWHSEPMSWSWKVHLHGNRIVPIHRSTGVQPRNFLGHLPSASSFGHGRHGRHGYLHPVPPRFEWCWSLRWSLTVPLSLPGGHPTVPSLWWWRWCLTSPHPRERPVQ